LFILTYRLTENGEVLKKWFPDDVYLEAFLRQSEIIVEKIERKEEF